MKIEQPQDVRATFGEEADKYLRISGHWVVASVRQQIGWSERSVLVEFRGQTLALLPEDDQRCPAVAFRKPSGMPDEEARTLIQQFLSSLVWAEGNSITIESWSGGGLPSRLSRSSFGQLRRLIFQIDYLPDPQDARARLALAFFREGLGLDHPAYAFLSLYKIINLVRSSGKAQIDWIESHIGLVSERVAVERIKSLAAEGQKVSEYLYASCRCAVAHAGVDPTIDPENLEDDRRLRLDMPLIRNLAEIAIEREFGIPSPNTVFREHQYELGGFSSVWGIEFVAKMRAKRSEPRKRVRCPARLYCA